jgi:hypothetical protein
MARKYTYIDDIADKVAERNKLTIKDSDAYMDAIVLALAEVASRQVHILDLVEKGIVERNE